MPIDADTKFVALVPMRHESERVPGKNYRSLAGKPLYGYILETLLACPQITQIVVDTDSPAIQEGVAQAYPAVTLIDRPDHLRGGMVPMNDVIAHDIDQVPSEFYLQTHSTNPLLKPGSVSAAIDAMRASYPAHDALFSVTRLQTRLWQADGSPLNHNPKELLRTQDLPSIYEENSCLYLFNREVFLKTGNRLGERPKMFELAPLETIDIDEEIDFLMVEALVTLDHTRNLG